MSIHFDTSNNLSRLDSERTVCGAIVAVCEVAELLQVGGASQAANTARLRSTYLCLAA